MNRFLILIFFIFSLFLLNTLKNNNNNSEKIKKPIGNEINSDPIINKINDNSKNINKIQSKIKIQQGIFSIYGFIAFEKPNNFSMVCNSILGKELEIGSNKDYFWFFSRNMKPKALYYCFAGDVEKTRLRKIFYPSLLKEFLCIHEINNKKLKINKDFIYSEEKINLGQQVFDKITIIKNNKIIGYLLFENDKMIIKIEILEFQKIDKKILPKKIKIEWIEENIEQEWILSETQINSNFSSWSMPDYKIKINLVDY